MRRTPVVVLAALISASAFANPKAPITAKHVDEKGDPKKDSTAAPAKMWWVSCYINARLKDQKYGTHTLYFGPWLAASSDPERKDNTKDNATFAEKLYAEYEPALGAEFPKFKYKPEQPPQRACMAMSESIT